MRILATLAALLLAPFAQAQDVTTATLDNGMEVVVIEDRRAPAVVHMVWYRAGSADEPAGTSGVAHFLEHLLFKATDDLESGELSRTVADNGGTDNAFTSFDYTAYFQRVAADRLGLMMSLEAERMNDIRLTDDDVETERRVIIEERAQRTDSSPGALAREQVMAAQYLNHRYGVPIIGWLHEMRQLGMDDVLAFYDRFYSPRNAILVVAGDVDPDDAIALARRHYGALPDEGPVPARARPQEPPQRAARRLTFEDPRVAQPYLTRSWIAPERDAADQADAAALVYLARLLGGSSFTSALNVALQFDSDVAVATGASYRPVALDDTTFSAYVVPAQGVSLRAAEDAMDAVIARFLDEGPTEEQMEAVRVQLRAAEIYARDDAQGLARRYGAALTSGLTVADVQAWPDTLEAVTIQDVLRVGRQVLVPERSVTAWVRPPAPEDAPASEDAPEDAPDRTPLTGDDA
ncbi:MAG: M16 family metallopeptidase [Paracoccaceae bacterium]